MAIGTCFCQNLASENQLRSKALEWIYAAQSWLSAPFQKGRLSVTGLQVHCLLLLARETNFVGPELVWISAGALLRTAIHMGLHRDSSHYPNMSPYNAEIRRRLWATVLEMAVQSSLDCGMPPLISYDDFDTAPPSNISDASLSPSDAPTSLVPHSLPPTTYTQTSLQIALLASLHTRLRVARLINHFRSKPTYEEVLHLSSRVMDSIREASLLLLAYNQPTNHSSLAKHPSSTPERPTAFHQNLLSHLQRRFLLALHRPFAIKALSNPQFYFSRKVCLEQALLISTPPPSPEYNRLASIGGGLWRETLTHGALTLCMELITQLDEDTRNVSLERQRAQRAPLHEAIRGVIGLAEERMRLGATNVKGLLFLNMALGQAEAIETGGAVSVEEGIFRAAKKAAQLGYEILRSRAAAAGVGNAVSIDVGSSRQDVAGNNNNRNMVGDGIAPPDAEMEEWLQDAILGDSDFDLGAKWLFPTLDEIPWASMGNFATQ